MKNNYNEIHDEIFKVIDELYSKYNLPINVVTDNEWAAFFYVIESHFLANGIIKDYNHALNIIIRRALYYVQVNNAKEFNVEYLKKALIDLIAFNISANEIEIMKNELDGTIKKYTK